MGYRRRGTVVRPFAVVASGGLMLVVGCSSGTGHPAQPSRSAGSSSSAVPLARQSAQQIMAATIDAVRAAGSVRVVAHDAQGSKTISFVDDISATAGRESIATNGGGRATFLLIAGVGYLRGNAAALEKYYEIPASIATRLSGRWISFRHGEQGYQQLTSQTRFSGLLDEISLQAPLARRGSSLAGSQPAVGVQGYASAATGAPAGTKVTLYVATTGRPLPLSLVSEVPGAHMLVTFSNWGEALHLTPPANSLPASALSG